MSNIVRQSKPLGTWEKGNRRRMISTEQRRNDTYFLLETHVGRCAILETSKIDTAQFLWEEKMRESDVRSNYRLIKR